MGVTGTSLNRRGRFYFGAGVFHPPAAYACEFLESFIEEPRLVGTARVGRCRQRSECVGRVVDGFGNCGLYLLSDGDGGRKEELQWSLALVDMI